jgi:hypothetical protein
MHRAARARILLPCTLYNYGPDAFPTPREDSPVLTTEPQTPLEQAVRTTLTGLGCLKSQGATHVSHGWSARDTQERE